MTTHANGAKCFEFCFFMRAMYLSRYVCVNVDVTSNVNDKCLYLYVSSNLEMYQPQFNQSERYGKSLVCKALTLFCVYAATFLNLHTLAPRMYEPISLYACWYGLCLASRTCLTYLFCRKLLKKYSQ